MSFDTPEDCQYLETHEWVRRTDGTARIGITDFAQDELGDVVFVELPAEGDRVEADEEFGVIESIKAVSDLYAPVSGTVTAVNEELFDAPELVNESPFGDGWMLEVEYDDRSEFDDLLSPAAYAEQTQG
jgi:glycine cleavage system H protein